MKDRLAERVEQVRLSGTDLAASVQVEPVPPSILTTVRTALLDGETHYTNRPGIPELRQRLAEEVERLGGPSYDSDSIVVTNSEREALYVVLLSLRFELGEVLVSAADTSRHARLFRLCQLCPVPATGTSVSTPLTRLIYREWPGNSDEQESLCTLGSGMKRSASQSFVDIVNIIDMGTRLGKSPTNFPPLTVDQTILIGNLESLRGMESFGRGFIAGPKEAIGPVRTWKQALSICTSAPSQRAAIAAIDLSIRDA